MAHILFITPYYPPENGAAPVRVSETATRLVKRGHRVTVLTTVPNYPTGIVPPEYRGRVIQEEMRDGVRVVRVWSYVTVNKGFLRRILAQLSFGCLVPLIGGKEIDHPDVIIVESHPLFNAIAGRMLSWRKHCPFILMVSDLWPEAAVQLGVLRNRILIRLGEWLECSTYERASFVWVVTEGIRTRLIERGHPPEHIFLLTNGVDTVKFRPLPKAQARMKLGWDDRFTVLYAGTHGPSHGLVTILDAAEQLRDCKDIHIILAGDGPEKADLLAQVMRRKLTNVTFLNAMPHDRVPLLLAAADVCLVHMRKLPLFKGNLPLKMFDAMACGRPIVLGIDGEARQLVEKEAGAAIYVEPENSSALATAIIYLHEHPEVRVLLGQRGRAFVEKHFDRDQLTGALDTRIEKLLNKKAPISIPAIPNSDSITSMPAHVNATREESQTY
jgi:colanic acid biosynthesis glycosyl transferase WcaI